MLQSGSHIVNQPVTSSAPEIKIIKKNAAAAYRRLDALSTERSGRGKAKRNVQIQETIRNNSHPLINSSSPLQSGSDTGVPSPTAFSRDASRAIYGTPRGVEFLYPSRGLPPEVVWLSDDACIAQWLHDNISYILGRHHEPTFPFPEERAGLEIGKHRISWTLVWIMRQDNLVCYDGKGYSVTISFASLCHSEISIIMHVIMQRYF